MLCHVIAESVLRFLQTASLLLLVSPRPGRQITGKFPGYISPSTKLLFSDIPNGLGAIAKARIGPCRVAEMVAAEFTSAASAAHLHAVPRVKSS